MWILDFTYDFLYNYHFVFIYTSVLLYDSLGLVQNLCNTNTFKDCLGCWSPHQCECTIYNINIKLFGHNCFRNTLNQMELRFFILITMNKKSEAVNKYFNTRTFWYFFQFILDENERSCANPYNYFLVQVWELSYQGKLTS